MEEIKGQLVQFPQIEGCLVHPGSLSIHETIDRIEKRACGYTSNTIQAALAKEQISQNKHGIPYSSSPAIAQYKLTDYYLLSEGDVWQTVALPLELSATPLLWRGKDKNATNEVRELFAPEQLDMYQCLLDMQLSMEQYEVAYPFQIWDGKIPLHLSILNPRYIALGTLQGFGKRPIWLSSSLGFDEHLTSLPDAIQNALTKGRSEKAGNSMMFQLDDEFCAQLRGWCNPWQAYPTAPFTRSFRQLATRQTLEELIKATIEGYKSQLWLFKVGDMDHPPNPGEIAKLAEAISGQSGERTGYLVWKGNVEVEQHVPKPLDSLLGNERWKELTQHIMRQRGISLRMIDGEVKQGSAQDAPSPLDIKVFMQRLKYRRSRIEEWANAFIRKYAEKNNMKEPPVVSFRDISLTIEERLKSVLTPLFSVGSLSTQTLLEESQVSTYEIELQRKKEEAKNAQFFGPKPTFSQTTVNPNTPEKTSEHTSPGRPNETGTKMPPREEVKAAYRDELCHVFEKLRADRDAKAFGLSVKEIGGRYLREHYEGGYTAAGGANGADEARIAALHAWHCTHLDGFVSDIETTLNDDKALDKFTSRVNLYAQGERQAHVYGVFQARREQGYSGWQRLAASDACDACKADSRVVHSIGEEFWDLHPGGNCVGDFVAFYRGPTSALPQVLPKPVGIDIMGPVVGMDDPELE